jgi:hypothetical protein
MLASLARRQKVISKLRSERLNSLFLDPLIKKMLSFYIETDVAAYRLLKDTANLLDNNLHVLEVETQGLRKSTDHIFLSQVIYNCFDTIEMLLWRAVRESIELISMVRNP